MPARNFADPAFRSGARPGPTLTEVARFGADPGNLRMLLYAPPGLPSAAPLVVVLHGCTQTAQGYAEGAGWLQLADRHRFAVLCPEQRQQNNPQRCFNWFQPEDVRRGGGEAESIRQMVETAVQLHGLDRGRVFVTGLSAGGAMTSALLASYPELFAAGAVVAGLPFGAAANVQEALQAMYASPQPQARALGDKVRAASPHRGPWPKVSVWHGDGDATVIPGNADAIALQWADVHGLDPAPSWSGKVGRGLRRVWADAAGEAKVESYTIRGMGHGAPLAAGGEAGCGCAGPFLLETGISSSGLICAFWGIAPEVEAAPKLCGKRPPSLCSTSGRSPRPSPRGSRRRPSADGGRPWTSPG